MTSNLPTISDLTNFFETLLPHHPKDNFPLLYHSPRRPPNQYHNNNNNVIPNFTPTYPPPTFPNPHITNITLTIKPTPQLYTHFQKISSHHNPHHPNPPPHPYVAKTTQALFIHHPWTLTRHLFPKNIYVYASHFRFDELLTTGYNVALADKLGMELETAVCLKGYKGDEERRIGIVGVFGEREEDRMFEDVRQSVEREFEGGAEVVGCGSADRGEGEGGGGVDGGKVVGDECVGGESAGPVRLKTEGVKVLALMNAFGPDEIRRVWEAALEKGWVGEGEFEKVVYITGEVKGLGKEALENEWRGMRALCVGHWGCEVWGVRWLAEEVRKRFVGLEVSIFVERDEEDEKREREKEKEKMEKAEKRKEAERLKRPGKRKKIRRVDDVTIRVGKPDDIVEIISS